MNLTNNEYGFSYGPASVQRLHSDDGKGVWLMISGAKERVEIRITKAGRIRVGEIDRTPTPEVFLPKHI